MNLFTEQQQQKRLTDIEKKNLWLPKGMDKLGAAGLTDTHNYI